MIRGWRAAPLVTCSRIPSGSSARPSPTRWKASSTGRGKAVVMQRRDGSLCIHSFAHGRTVYKLVEHSQTVATNGYAAREDGRPGPDDLWRDELIRGKSGRPLGNFANCLIALRGAHQLRDLFAFDEMELTAVVTRPSLLGDRGVFPQPVTDDTVAGVWDWLQRNGLPSATIDAVHRAVDKVSMDRPFHPLREYPQPPEYTDSMKSACCARFPGWHPHVVG